MKRFLLCVLFAGLPLQAMAEVYECTATNRGSGGWIPEKIFVELNTADQTASAYDYFINSIHKKPIKVDLKKRKDTSYKLSWKLRNVDISNEGSGILSHSMVLNTAAKTYTMNGRLHGYDNVIRGSGTCKVMKR